MLSGYLPNDRVLELLSKNAVSGAVSGFFIGTLLQPLEIIKLCLIVNPPEMGIVRNANFAESFYTSARFVYKVEGMKGFWKGLSPSLLRIGTASSIYFHFLEIFQQRLSSYKMNKRFSDFASSAAARTLSTTICNPLTVLKTRMELPGSRFAYRGMEDAIQKIYKHEGSKAFFKGAGACVLRDVPFAGLYFTIMNISKEQLRSIKIPSSANIMISGLFAGVIATAVTHPFEVARAHLQVKNDHINNRSPKEALGTFDVLRNVVNTEGKVGLFRGLQARIVRKPLSNALTFTFYELLNKAGKREKSLI